MKFVSIYQIAILILINCILSEGVFYDSTTHIGISVNNYQENAGNVRIVSLGDQREYSLSSLMTFQT